MQPASLPSRSYWIAYDRFQEYRPRRVCIGSRRTRFRQLCPGDWTREQHSAVILLTATQLGGRDKTWRRVIFCATTPPSWRGSCTCVRAGQRGRATLPRRLFHARPAGAADPRNTAPSPMFQRSEHRRGREVVLRLLGQRMASSNAGERSVYFNVSRAMDARNATAVPLMTTRMATVFAVDAICFSMGVPPSPPRGVFRPSAAFSTRATAPSWRRGLPHRPAASSSAPRHLSTHEPTIHTSHLMAKHRSLLLCGRPAAPG
jgi:hypothetical protein